MLFVLVEKSFTTPDQYPLSTNALVNGCNQQTSREPVVAYTAQQVDSVMQNLRASGWARTVRTTGSRTDKHKHVVAEQIPVTDSQLALLAVLGLRGPQSPGELKTRTERYVAFGGPGDVVVELAAMAAMAEPLVRNVGTRPGQSQDRWVQLLGRPEEIHDDVSDQVPAEMRNDESASAPSPIAVERRAVADTSTAEAVERLRQTVSDLQHRIEILEQTCLDNETAS